MSAARAVDFEAGDQWWDRLTAAVFDTRQPAIVASTGVSMYLTRDAIVATLRHVAALAAGATLVMSFMLPVAMQSAELRPAVERAAAGAAASGTPFVSLFTPAEMLALARDAADHQEHDTEHRRHERKLSARRDVRTANVLARSRSRRL